MVGETVHVYYILIWCIYLTTLLNNDIKYEDMKTIHNIHTGPNYSKAFTKGFSFVGKYKSQHLGDIHKDDK